MPVAKRYGPAGAAAAPPVPSDSWWGAASALSERRRAVSAELQALLTRLLA